MPASSKPGSSRIPSFGFRLPQLRSTSTSNVNVVAGATDDQPRLTPQSRIASGFKVPSLRSFGASLSASSTAKSTENNTDHHPSNTRVSSSTNVNQIHENVAVQNSRSVESNSIKSTIKKLVQSVSSSHSKEDVTQSANNAQNQIVGSQEKLNSVSESHASTKITQKHLGKNVRVGEKEGTLRYVGIVHFSEGPWCGIELCQPIGKNDGVVKGVRYFSCAQLYGLMAPLQKVTLIEEEREPCVDNDSGPYSMLFFNNNFSEKEKHDGTTILDTNRQKTDVFELHDKPRYKEERTETLVHEESVIINQDTLTFRSLKNRTQSVESLNQYRAKNSTFDFVNNTRSIENLSKINIDGTTFNKGNCTYDKGSSTSCHGSTQNLPGNQTYDCVACSTESLHQINKTFDLHGSNNHLNRTITQNNLQNIIENQETCESHPVLYRQDTFEAVKIDAALTGCTFTNSKKRTNETFDYEQNHTPTKSDDLGRDSEFVAPVHKSFEDILQESKVEVKRRRTSNSKAFTIENIVLKNLPLDKPSSLPQLKSVHSENGFVQRQSTPLRGESTSEIIAKPKWRISDIKSENTPLASSKEDIFIFDEDDSHNKRDSLDCEDTSLGILTPNQMTDFIQNRSPSLEYSPFDISRLVGKKGSTDYEVLEKEAPAFKIPQSPNCNSTTDYSLGILDVQMLSTFSTLKTDTTMNLDLPLDSVEQMSKGFAITRCDQTPSPEELPLDTTPIVESDQSIAVKSELIHMTELTETSDNLTSSQKSKPSSTYVTSITTSITSLDTGYQGDGEMSRPASRGADNSPLTRRPLLRPQPRRPDPMTDSDFYTESDADNHDDNQCKESRRAQVIDGTLYGVDPQAAADIYVNNRENMDSSGIFTDIESAGNGRNEEEEEEDMEDRIPEKEDGPIIIADVSPTESTTKSISINSQDNIQELLHKSQTCKPIDEKGTINKSPKEVANSKKRNAPSPGLGSPASLNSPRRTNNKENHENATKKYKMPKRDVASKVKTMLDNNRDSPTSISDKKSAKKPAGRWDAVMNKISKNDQTQPNFKDVKSKVFNNVGLPPSSVDKRTSDVRKSSPRSVCSQSTKNRRVRTRTSHTSSPLKNSTLENNENSIHSSLSDLSASTNPPKKSGSAKKRDTIQVTQVLTPNKLSRTQASVTENNKKNAANSNLTPSPSSATDVKIKRNIFPSKEKKQSMNANSLTKDCNKPVTKPERTSPTVRSPSLPSNQQRTPNNPQSVTVKNQRQQTARQVVDLSNVQVPKAAEALAVLVHHLVVNVEAFQVPHLRRQVEKFRLEADEIRLACQNLEETLSEERLMQVRIIEEERARCRKDITDLIEKHRNYVEELNNHHSDLIAEKENARHCLVLKHEEQLTTVGKELEKLQKSHQEALDILREENDSIREQIDEKRLELDKMKHESFKLKDDYEKKEIKLKGDLEYVTEREDKLKQQLKKIEKEFEEKMSALELENRHLREENDRLLSYGDDKDKAVVLQEVQSLRVVLELKQTEVTELRKSLAEATQKLETLSGVEERATTLQARCEDLQLQLQRKTEFEQSLISENQKLQDTIQEECNQKKRLHQYNEELHWKIQQNKEVITKVMEVMENQGGGEEVFNRSNSIYSSSFNEKHTPSNNRSNIERAYSFRERSLSNKSIVSLDGLGSQNRTRKSKNSISELFDMDDVSPPTSPKVKGVVEKSDSVSYVLDLDESPEVVANRIVRRSFRNSTPPKNNTPTKSPSNKRPRMRNNPLSMSASSSSIVTPMLGGQIDKGECDRPRSASAREGKEFDDVFLWDHAHSTPKQTNQSNDSIKIEDQDLDDTVEEIQLPALPSELDKRNIALPSPKHLAGDNNVASDSNSEDESTSSSQL